MSSKISSASLIQTGLLVLCFGKAHSEIVCSDSYGQAFTDGCNKSVNTICSTLLISDLCSADGPTVTIIPKKSDTPIASTRKSNTCIAFPCRDTVIDWDPYLNTDSDDSTTILFHELVHATQYNRLSPINSYQDDIPSPTGACVTQEAEVLAVRGTNLWRQLVHPEECPHTTYLGCDIPKPFLNMRKPFCGDGVISPGEECDPGIGHVKADIPVDIPDKTLKCGPRGTAQQCQLITPEECLIPLEGQRICAKDTTNLCSFDIVFVYRVEFSQDVPQPWPVYADKIAGGVYQTKAVVQPGDSMIDVKISGQGTGFATFTAHLVQNYDPNFGRVDEMIGGISVEVYIHEGAGGYTIERSDVGSVLVANGPNGFLPGTSVFAAYTIGSEGVMGNACLNDPGLSFPDRGRVASHQEFVHGKTETAQGSCNNGASGDTRFGGFRTRITDRLGNPLLSGSQANDGYVKVGRFGAAVDGSAVFDDGITQVDGTMTLKVKLEGTGVP